MQTTSLLGGRSSRKAGEIRLERFLPSITSQAASILEELATAIRVSAEWQSLDAAYNSVVREVLLDNLKAAYSEFRTRYAQMRASGLRGEELQIQAFILVQEIYIDRNESISTYVEAFERYEGLLQRIYWLLSHLVFYESISCIATDKEPQLQQVLCFLGDDAYLTAVAPTFAKTLRTGQLVHITTPEFSQWSGGIFQIERWNLEWDVSTGARIYIRAKHHWAAASQEITHITSPSRPILTPSEGTPVIDIINDFSLTVLDEDGYGEQTRLREMSWAASGDESLSYPRLI